MLGAPRALFFLLTLCIGAASACLPFVVPPARLEMGPGLRLHEDRARDVKDGTALIRAAVHPMQVLDGAADQLFDVGVGYRAELPLHDEGEARTLAGPYAELGVYALRVPLGSSTRLRWGGYASADLDLTSTEPVGFGTTLGTLLEITGSSGGPFANHDADSHVLGMAKGQWGIGIFANTSLREVRSDFTQGISAGLSVRIPFMAGVVCCAWSWSSHDGSSSHAPHRHETHRERGKREYRRATPRREP